MSERIFETISINLLDVYELQKRLCEGRVFYNNPTPREKNQDVLSRLYNEGRRIWDGNSYEELVSQLEPGEHLFAFYWWKCYMRGDETDIAPLIDSEETLRHFNKLTKRAWRPNRRRYILHGFFAISEEEFKTNTHIGPDL